MKLSPDAKRILAIQVPEDRKVVAGKILVADADGRNVQVLEKPLRADYASWGTQ